MKSFGRRLAYESPRGTNPRAAGNGLWVFLFSAERGAVTTGSGKRRTLCNLSELLLDLMVLALGVAGKRGLRDVADDGSRELGHWPQ